MREFKVGDKVSFEYNTDGLRADGIVFSDTGTGDYPLYVKPIDPTAIGWDSSGQATYTRDGRYLKTRHVELILIEPEAQNTVDMKNGDRVLIEFEVRIQNGLEFPYRLHPVFEDGTMRDTQVLSLSEEHSYLLGEKPLKLTIIERGFRVGDRVKCPLYGEGTISAVKDVGAFPVEVDFDNGKDSMYTKDGRWRVDLNPTLERLEEGTTHASVGV